MFGIWTIEDDAAYTALVRQDERERKAALRKNKTRLTPRALDRGDSAVDTALSTPEGYTGKAADTTPAPGK